MWVAMREIPHLTQIGVSAVAIFNHVAVHPTLNILNERHPDGEYTITHLVSGWAIENRIPSAGLALEYACRLDALPEMGYHANVVRRSPRVLNIVKELKQEMEVVT